MNICPNCFEELEESRLLYELYFYEGYGPVSYTHLVHAFAYSAGSRAAIQVRQNDTKIVLSRIQRDEEIQYLDAEGNLSFVGYCSLNDKAYRGLFYNSYEEEALSRLDVWEAGTSNLLISVSVKTKLDTFMHWFAIAGTDESPIPVSYTHLWQDSLWKESVFRSKAETMN